MTVLAIFRVIGIYAGWLQVDAMPVTMGVDTQIEEFAVSWSGFDGNARVANDNPYLFRIQSFAIEPGAYALAATVALYWLILVRQSVFRFLIIAMGIAGSWSLGGVLAIAMVLVFILMNGLVSRTVKAKLFFVIIFYFAVHAVTPVTLQLVGDKSISLSARIVESKQVVAYLTEHPLGAGIGEARKQLKSSISVGYMNALAESGVVGGFFMYCHLGCCLGCPSYRWRNQIRLQLKKMSGKNKHTLRLRAPC